MVQVTLLHVWVFLNQFIPALQPLTLLAELLVFQES